MFSVKELQSSDTRLGKSGVAGFMTIIESRICDFKWLVAEKTRIRWAYIFSNRFSWSRLEVSLDI